MIKDRHYFSDLITNKISENLEKISAQINKQIEGNSDFLYFYIDDLLPTEDALEIHSKFPTKDKMKENKSIREHKLIDAQLDNHDKILEEITYAIQEKNVIDIIGKILNKDDLVADEFLYAGGLSRMEEGNYLNPHLDNSHDKDRNLYRSLNLLYYVTPDRKEEDGANLELWDHGLENEKVVIHSKFNRLVIMVTNKKSWHAVSKVKKGYRCCVSNYYFSKTPMIDEDYFHVTSFRGFPEEKIKDVVLKGDIALRSAIRKIFPKGAVETKHVYKK